MKNSDIRIILKEDPEEFIYIYNSYKESINAYDDLIYNIDDLNELLCNMSPYDILCRGFFGDFNPNHAWFLFDGYGNLQSFQYVDFYFEDDDFLLDEIQEWYQR